MEFEIGPCGPEALGALLALQEAAFAGMEDPSLLRRNTPEMLASCLRPPHVTLGAWRGEALAGFAVLYRPGAEEDLSRSLSVPPPAGTRAANYKLCIVRPDARGHGLQCRLGLALEKCAQRAGIGLLCATVSPRNRHSADNLRRMGYVYDRTLTKYGLERELYKKYLPEGG